MYYLYAHHVANIILLPLLCITYNTSQHIFSLLYNDNIDGKKGGVLAIRELVKCPSAIPDAKTAKFSQVLSIALSTNTHFEILESIAGVIGYIAKHTPVPLVDYIEAELARALEWLEGNIPHRRLAACAVLEQLANNTPTLFFVQCKAFFDLIWSPLRDPKERIRLCAAQALSACLCDLDKRTYHLQWYCSLFEQVLLGYTEGTLEAVHGSLLVTEELLKYTGDFMLPRYKEVQLCTVLHCTALYCTARCRTIRYCCLRHFCFNIILFHNTQHRTIHIKDTTQHRTLLCSVVVIILIPQYVYVLTGTCPDSRFLGNRCVLQFYQCGNTGAQSSGPV